MPPRFLGLTVTVYDARLGSLPVGNSLLRSPWLSFGIHPDGPTRHTDEVFISRARDACDTPRIAPRPAPSHLPRSSDTAHPHTHTLTLTHSHTHTHTHTHTHAHTHTRTHTLTLSHSHFTLTHHRGCRRLRRGGDRAHRGAVARAGMAWRMTPATASNALRNLIFLAEWNPMRWRAIPARPIARHDMQRTWNPRFLRLIAF